MPTTSSNTKIAESWDDEFAEDDDNVMESWDAEEEEKPKPKPKAKPAASSKKSAAASKSKNPEINLDLLDEATRKALLKKAEEESDLNNAADLFGGLGVAEHPRERQARAAAALAASAPAAAQLTKDSPIGNHPLFQPETKQDFEKLRKALAPEIVKLAEKSQLNYSSGLVIDLIRDISMPLTSENIRKTISTLQVLLKDKERVERQQRLAKAGGTATGGAGKKKAKSARPNLGGAFKKDNDLVADNFDDFGDDDFM